MRTRSLVVLSALAMVMAVPAHARSQVTVEAQLAAEIVDRMPANPSTAFSVDVGEVVCWTSVTGAADTTIQHIWIHGEMEFPVSLRVGGSPWRTWSTKTIPAEWAGDWRVEIRDERGNLLDSVSFTVGG